MEHTHASLRSSVSSLYRNYDFHLDVMKLTGVVILLSLMTATLSLVIHMDGGRTDPVELTKGKVILNASLCTYAEQFPLPQNFFVTVCTYQAEIRIDVRKFIGDTPTILGYFVNEKQWNHLKKLVPSIDQAVVNAKTQLHRGY